MLLPQVPFTGKFATTDFEVDMFREHTLPFTLSHPVQTVGLGVACKVTTVSLLKEAVHVEPQLIAGEVGEVLTTVPVPFIDIVSV